MNVAKSVTFVIHMRGAAKGVYGTAHSVTGSAVGIGVLQHNDTI